MFDNGARHITSFNSLPPDMLIIRTFRMSPGIGFPTFKFYTLSGVIFIQRTDYVESCNETGNREKRYYKMDQIHDITVSGV